MVVQTPEWKFKANIARNATLEGRYEQIFAQFGSKVAQGCFFLRISLLLVSLKVTKLMIIQLMSFLNKMLFEEFIIWVF